VPEYKNKSENCDDTYKNGVPLYVQGTFDKQLNYNLWSTSRTRFIASRRLKSKDTRSSKAIAFLSAYLIVFTLSDYVFFKELDNYNSGYILLLNVTFSILILIFSQMESSQSYGIRAVRFHECGLEVSSLYKKLRKLKSRYDGHEKDEDFYKEVEEIDKEYDLTLKSYENHELIDFELFKSNYPKYEDHSLSCWDVWMIKQRHYIKDVLVYHIVTYVPMIVFLYFVFKVIKNI